MSERSWLTVLHSCLCYYPQNKQGCIISPCDYMCFSPAQALVMIYSCLCLEEGQMVWMAERGRTDLCVCVWRDVTYGQVWWPILGICALQINPSKVHTHSSELTHTVNTHPEQWAAIYAAAPGEQLGVRCLAQGHLSRGIEGGESFGYSLPPPTTRHLWVTSPTL